MIFDHCQRPISKITDQELKDLIGNQEENLWIDFKQRDYHRDPDDQEKHKREICKDVTAMANAEGGYIFIGIQEKHEIAQGFFTVTNPDQIVEDVSNVCRQSIEPAIQHLDVKKRSFEWHGAQVTLVVIHIPPSEMRPHGFKWKGSFNFVRRYEDHTTEYPMSELGLTLAARYIPPVIYEINEKLDAISRNIQQIGER